MTTLGKAIFRKYSERRLYLMKLGGRFPADVQTDEDGREYVLFWNGRAHDSYKHYLPIFNDEWLERNSYPQNQFD